jgi:hypothetical protein
MEIKRSGHIYFSEGIQKLTKAYYVCIVSIHPNNLILLTKLAAHPKSVNLNSRYHNNPLTAQPAEHCSIDGQTNKLSGIVPRKLHSTLFFVNGLI